MKNKLDKFFKIEERGSSITTEIISGLTIFLTMAYVLAVQPSAIIGFGPHATFTDASGLLLSRGALLVSCAVVTGIVTIAMGAYTNLPLAISTAMGTNFLLGGLVQSGQFTFGGIMAALLISGTLFIIVSITGLRSFIVKMIPKNLKFGLTIAVGFFIAQLGFKNSGLANFDGGLKIGDITSPPILLTLITIVIIAILQAYKVKGAILIGIIAGTLIGIPMKVTMLPASLVGLPSATEMGNLLFSYDFRSLFAHVPTALVWIFILFFGDFFGTLSCVTAVGIKTGLADKDGNFPDMDKPFLVDSIGTVLGSATGNTTISTFIESTAGIASGGRTGLSAVVVGLLFFVAVIFAPAFLMIPTAATAAALIIVGFSMVSTFTQFDFDDFVEVFGPLLLIFITVFTGSLPAGISFGILGDVLMKVVTGNYKRVHPGMYVVCVPLVLYLLV
jgi:AGZA family xanthine/uracil permease-like MFS transporter